MLAHECEGMLDRGGEGCVSYTEEHGIDVVCLVIWGDPHIGGKV
jgi:hypothetical protein